MQINLIDKNDKALTIIFGLYKYILKDFAKNNVQLKGGWYLNDRKQYEEVANFITAFKPDVINLIGTSKSCTGAFIYADKLSKLFPDVLFKTFAFSAYTTLDEAFYLEHGLTHLPPSLTSLWEEHKENKNYFLEADLKRLMSSKNLHTYLLYPCLSDACEVELVNYIPDRNNITKIKVHTKFHNILFIFWNKINPDLKIELFEDTVKKIPKESYHYLQKIQNCQEYSFSLYNLFYDTESFIMNFSLFNDQYLSNH